MRISAGTQKRFSSQEEEVAVAIFEVCEACANNIENMSVPQGAFAAKKVRKNMEKYEDQFFHDGKQEASRYNSKYMNSIWGMYNRFSVHNLKKVMDDNSQKQGNVGQAVKAGLAASSTLSVSAERLNYLPM